jgi:hypothetical protein
LYNVNASDPPHNSEALPLQEYLHRPLSFNRSDKADNWSLHQHSRPVIIFVSFSVDKIAFELRTVCETSILHRQAVPPREAEFKTLPRRHALPEYLQWAMASVSQLRGLGTAAS